MQMSRESIRPSTTLEEAKNIIREFYGLEVIEIKELECYSDRTFYLKVQQIKNGLDAKSGTEFIFKVLNSIDSAKEHVDAEHEIRELLNRNGFVCPVTVRNKYNDLKSSITIAYQDLDGATYNKVHVIRLLTYLPGEIFGDVPMSKRLFTSVGRCMAGMQEVIKNFKHPGLENYETVWSLENVPNMRKHYKHLSSDQKIQKAEMVIKSFEENVVPYLYEIERGVIHGDFNERNIIVDKIEDPSTEHREDDDDYDITAVIDFGDMMCTCLIFDLACAIVYVMLENKGVFSDPVDAGGYVLRGFLSVKSISEAELRMLPYCVMGRYVQSLTMGAYSYSLDPGNEYLLNTSKEGWKILDMLIDLGAEKTLQKWLKISEAYL